jgi:hypothetical protein
MISQEFVVNRARFPCSELAKYCGAWVAFSDDGQRIVASQESLEQLEDQLASKGIDAQQLVFEFVPGADDDIQLGAGDQL